MNAPKDQGRSPELSDIQEEDEEEEPGLRTASSWKQVAGSSLGEEGTKVTGVRRGWWALDLGFQWPPPQVASCQPRQPRQQPPLSAHRGLVWPGPCLAAAIGSGLELASAHPGSKHRKRSFCAATGCDAPAICVLVLGSSGEGVGRPLCLDPWVLSVTQRVPWVR